MEHLLCDLQSVYFIGIGGISMSSLALILKGKGIPVAGYDRRKSENTDMLEQEGVRVYFSHDTKNLDGFSTVVYNAAIKPDDPELLEAKKRGLMILTRAKLLGMITASYPCSVGVAGTHGKSTTTGMIFEIFRAEDPNSTVLAGAVIPSIRSTYQCGNGSLAVFEACEYKDSYHEMKPAIKVVLNVGHDHIDYFPTLRHVIRSFRAFLDIPRDHACKNIAVVNADCENSRSAAEGTSAQVRYFSIREKADFYAENIDISDGFGEFDIFHKDGLYVHIKLAVPGLHNISNAMAAAAAAYYAGVSKKAIAAGLAAFRGVKRRFETKGFVNGAAVIDDYAHHPQEIAATLAAAKGLPFGRVICIFQPHTYSRTKKLLPEFAQALRIADKAILADIYAAREQDNVIVSSKDIADLIEGGEYFSSFEEIARFVKGYIKSGDAVITMGAGDIHRMFDLLVQ